MKTFIVTIQYLEPCEGTTYTTAKTADEAKAKIEKLFSLRPGLKVCDVVESSVSQLELDMGGDDLELPDNDEHNGSAKRTVN